MALRRAPGVHPAHPDQVVTLAQEEGASASSSRPLLETQGLDLRPGPPYFCPLAAGGSWTSPQGQPEASPLPRRHHLSFSLSVCPGCSAPGRWSPPFQPSVALPEMLSSQNGVKTVPSLCEREVTCVLTDGSWPRGPGAGLAAQTDLHGPSLDVQEEPCFSEEVRRDGSLCLTEEAGRRHRAPRCSWHPRRRSGRRRVGVSAAPLCSAAEGGVPVASELLAARPIATRPAGLPACPQARGRLERALTPCSLALASCAECHSVSTGGLGH